MYIKRPFDFIVSLFGLLILWPFLIIISIIIRLQMPGPVFFTQKRIGLHGKLFTLIKFRTMTIDHGGSSISVGGEPRITSLGARLRKYKLDELPELWNVLKGNMSFVGPRPDVPGYADKLTGEERLILELRPGITGPASMKYADEEEILASLADPVKYNNEIIWPDKVRINLEYYHRQNFWLDLKIIVLTVLGKQLDESWV